MSKNINVMYMKTTDNWKTPTKIYNHFMKMGYIDCFKYKDTENEFEKKYENKKLFINPPFSKMKKLPKWIYDQIENECEIALLIPARTDTKYFHELLMLCPTIYFIKGRLKYNDIGTAPFPTILMTFNKRKKIPIYIATTQENISYGN